MSRFTLKIEERIEELDRLIKEITNDPMLSAKTRRNEKRAALRKRAIAVAALEKAEYASHP